MCNDFHISLRCGCHLTWFFHSIFFFCAAIFLFVFHSIFIFIIILVFSAFSYASVRIIFIILLNKLSLFFLYYRFLFFFFLWLLLQTIRCSLFFAPNIIQNEDFFFKWKRIQWLKPYLIRPICKHSSCIWYEGTQKKVKINRWGREVSSEQRRNKKVLPKRNSPNNTK